jgi:hypothetical protein
VGPRIPWWDSDAKKDRKVYPIVSRGDIRIYPSAGRIVGTMDVFLMAYWDGSAYSINAEGWKDLIGSGRGTYIFDWENDFYRYDFQGTLLDLVHGQLQFQLSKGELVLFATVRLSPTPGSLFDFWPVNKIDISASILLILAEKHKLFAGWARIKIIFFDATVGFGYDFINKDGFWILGEGKVNELVKLKDQYLAGGNGTEVNPFIYGQTYQTEANVGATALYSSRYTLTIPFMTEDISGTFYPGGPLESNWSIAKILESSDIRVTIDPFDEKKQKEHFLPAGTSYTYSVILNPLQPIPFHSGKFYRTGSIIVDIYPNTKMETDFTKTFASLGIDKLIVDVKVGLKQNSMFFNTDMDDRETSLFAQSIHEKPWDYIQKPFIDINTLQWDSSKKITIDGKEFPLLPAQFDSFVTRPPSMPIHPT